MTNDMDFHGHQPSDSRLLYGLLVGAAVGAGLALLVAPRQGADTRHHLASGAQRAGRRLNEAYGTVADSVRQGARRLTAEAQHLRHRAEDVADDAADSLRAAVDEATERFQSSGTSRPMTAGSRSPLG